MKTFALALFLLTSSSTAMSITDELAQWSLREHFSLFEHKFSKAYATAAERESRFLVFVENLEQIISKNMKLHENGEDQVHGVTKFADWTKDEFAARLLNPSIGSEPLPDMPVAVPKKGLSVAASFDWRDEGVVTDVKNQGYCGSCWAHSAVETVESQYAINGGELTKLSVQQATSCDTVNYNCSGGWYYTSWTSYMNSSGGLTTAENYPYDNATYYGKATACDATLEAEVVSGTSPKSYSWATTPCSSLFCSSQDEDTLKSNLASYGPISIAVDASEWSSYSSGIMTSSSCYSSAYKLDHAVQLVAYNTSGSTSYWVVRNSWDTTWGVDGYIYLKMGSNTCGLADKAAMVTL